MIRSYIFGILPLVCGTAFVAMCYTPGQTACGEKVQSARDHLEPANLDKQLTAHELERERLRVSLTSSLHAVSPEVQYAAAYLLGLYRYAEAVNDLANAITLHAETIQQSKEARWGQFPVVEALIRIGEPSVRAMLANLETSDDANVRGLSARVIFFVEGPELSKIVVQNAVKAQTDPDKKKRLQDALPLVKGGEYQVPQAR